DMNTFTFLALVITTAYGLVIKVKVNGTFHCSYNKNATIQLWDWDLIGDDKLASMDVAAGQSFHLVGEEDEWIYIQPYIIIKHRCNPCDKDTVIRQRLSDLYADHTFDFGVINLDNLESSRCLKWF
ncbi:hypothetical protein V3C99_018932, partial [Haemonchus contortus]